MKLDFQNKLFRIGYRNVLPFTNIDPSLEIFAGIEGKLIQIIADHFNFTIEFIESHYEGRLKDINGNWTGLIGQIQEGRFDMGIGAISINYNRIFAVNFLEPHYIDSFTFITNPAAKHIGFDVLMRPFRHEVWFVFFFMLIIASLFQQFEKYMTSITNIVRDQKSSTSKHNIFWINLCLLFRQPYSKLVQINLSLKIFAIIWAISALILTNSYAGCLCSIMALPSEQVIDSVEKLAMECRLKHISTIGINTDYYTSMKNSSNPTLQNIGQDMKFVSDRHKGIQKVLSYASRNHNYAFPGSHEQFLFTKIMIGWNQLYLPPSTASFFPLFYAIPVPKTFIYRDEFNQIIKHANEAGFLKCWRLLEILKVFRKRRKNALEKVKIQSSSSSSSSSSANINIKYHRFSMLHMEIIFELYQITWTIAMITLISELFIYYRLMSRLISNINRLFNHITNQYDRHG